MWVRSTTQSFVLSFVLLGIAGGFEINVPVEHSIGGSFTTAGSLQGSILELVSLQPLSFDGNVT